MKAIYHLAIITFLSISIANSQASSGVPFIAISPSGEANGMGGISSTILTPSSMYFNPAYLGMLSQTSQAGIEFYLQSNRLNLYADLTYNHYAFVYGLKLFTESENTPTLGVGYSRTVLDFGDGFYTSGYLWEESGTRPNYGALRKFDMYESSDNFSLGFAYNFGILLSYGITVKQITSRLGGRLTADGVTYYTAKPVAVDLGLALKFPLIDLVSFITDASDLYLSFADVGISYAINNWGQEVKYNADPNQSDPLPRTARLGWSFEAGYNYSSENMTINLASIAFAREGESHLYAYDSASFYYLSFPLGRMKPYQSLVEGRYYDFVGIRKGFSVNLFETVFIRRGSYQQWSWNKYTAEGIAFSTGGLFKFITMAMKEQIQSEVLSFILKRIEIRYNRAAYSNPDLFGGSEFENISLMLHY